MPDQAPSPLSFEIERAGNDVVVRCHGKLVAGVNEILYAAVRPMIPDTKRIVLDLTDLTHMDSMGLGSVVRLYVSAKSAGCDLELINFGERIRKMLSTTHLLSVLASIGQQGVAII
jgi:anti-sigma B factor antagonist